MGDQSMLGQEAEPLAHLGSYGIRLQASNAAGGKDAKGLGSMGVFVQTVMIKITQLLENNIRLRTFNCIYAGSRQGHHGGWVLGCPTSFRQMHGQM